MNKVDEIHNAIMTAIRVEGATIEDVYAASCLSHAFIEMMFKTKILDSWSADRKKAKRKVQR